MIKFQHDKSYWWLFWIFIVWVVAWTLFGAFAFQSLWLGPLSIMVSGLSNLIGEIRSGCILNQAMKAEYLKGRTEYKVMLAVHGVSIILIGLLPYIVWSIPHGVSK